MPRIYRLTIVASLLWIILANMLYFNELKATLHPCHEKSTWVRTWNFFTLGVQELFPFKTVVTSMNLEEWTQGKADLQCHEAYHFDELGYAYFLFGPIVFLGGLIRATRWALGHERKPS